MGFSPISAGSLVRFNSATSCSLLDLYDEAVDNEIRENALEPKHKSFAPSQFRCARVSWFRLRGTQPDKVITPDRGLQFTADIGTACHEIIQKRLSKTLGADWIDVEDYLKSVGIEAEVEKVGYETRVNITKPYPCRFSCDGLIRLNGQIYLLEIKTSDHSSFEDLTDPKPKHIDQVKLYCTLLGITKVLFLYVDRQYEGRKCFEYIVSDADKQEIKHKMQYIVDMVEANIAPSSLPKGDSSCTPSMCPYYKVCQEWGR